MYTHPLVGWSARLTQVWLYKANYCGVPRIVFEGAYGIRRKVKPPSLSYFRPKWMKGTQIQ